MVTFYNTEHYAPIARSKYGLIYFLPAHFQNQSNYFKLPSCLLTKLQVLSIQVERILSQSSLKTCSCPLLRYFGTLFRDDITIFWDENL